MTDFSVEASADCPIATIELAGTNEEDLADLATAITDYSDGATVELEFTHGEDFYTAWDGESIWQFWFGTELLSDAAANGAYGILQPYSYENTSTGTSDAP